MESESETRGNGKQKKREQDKTESTEWYEGEVQSVDREGDEPVHVKFDDEAELRHYGYEYVLESLMEPERGGGDKGGPGRRVRGGAARARRVQAAAGRWKEVAVPAIASTRGRRRSRRVQGVRRVVDVRARPPTQRVQGVRRDVDVRARPPTQAVQGVRRVVDMRARPPTQQVQGVRRVVDMRARPPTQQCKECGGASM